MAIEAARLRLPGSLQRTFAPFSTMLIENSATSGAHPMKPTSTHTIAWDAIAVPCEFLT